MQHKLSLAYFLPVQDPGHVRRAACLMNSIHAQWPFVHFEVFSGVREDVLKNHLQAAHACHNRYPGTALVHDRPRQDNPEEKAEFLQRSLSFGQEQVGEYSQLLSEAGCCLAISDTSPLAIAAAGKAGIASVLVEDYFWTEVYKGLFSNEPFLKEYADMLGKYLHQADLRIDLPAAEDSHAQHIPEHQGYGDAARAICHYLVQEQEILEVVDREGCVLGAAPRKRVHGNNSLLHRVVHVLVFDDQDRLLLQKRSLNKRVAPGRWDTSVGGHVDCGESIETAMYREMQEELGIRPRDVQFAYKYIHSNDFESELVYTYTCRYDGQVEFNPEEIDAVKFWKTEEIEENLGNGTLSDNFEDEFRLYRQWMGKR
ncbi:NUDIX domain-containing protein [Desulfonatronospira sp. MSAO_Bac3]|uniref:NUDIX hydrolase n=1 Tax=Desulfonatronospira sp. MSAO_Bac3 TaxID=2293857 RepID=UPI00257C8094|nr:NUDIX domain-containing protein [Desulfonatronospira sp. MSAO_Bac3]